MKLTTPIVGDFRPADVAAHDLHLGSGSDIYGPSLTWEFGTLRFFAKPGDAQELAAAFRAFADEFTALAAKLEQPGVEVVR